MQSKFLNIDSISEYVNKNKKGVIAKNCKGRIVNSNLNINLLFC